MKRYLISMLVLLSACTKSDIESDITPGSTTTTLEMKSAPSLSWDSKEERKAWSAFLMKELLANLDTFDQAKDASRFCARYEGFLPESRARMWAEVIIWTAWYESAWSPVSRMQENQGLDSVTGKPVFSEGLLQLSYQDVPNYNNKLGVGWSGIDWKLDRNLGAKDPKKTILDPYINLRSGLKILGYQIKSHGEVLMPDHVYWSTLDTNHKKQTYLKILSAVKKAMNCD